MIIKLCCLILSILLSSCFTHITFDERGNPQVTSTSDVGNRTDFHRQGRAGLLANLSGDTSSQTDSTTHPGDGIILAENTKNGTKVIMRGVHNPLQSKLPDTVTDALKIGITGKSIDNLVNKVTGTAEIISQ